jgi:hypothetical protein
MKDEEGTFRDHIATVNEKGKRIWIFQKGHITIIEK